MAVGPEAVLVGRPAPAAPVAEQIDRIEAGVMWRAKLARTMLSLAAATALFGGGFHFAYAYALDGLDDGTVDPAVAGSFWAVYGLGDVPFIAAAFAVLLCFGFWQWELQRAAQHLGGHGFRLAPEWGLVWWFIPLANIFMPKLVLVQAWRGTDPVTPAPSARGLGGPVVGWLWWATLWIVFVGGVLVAGLDPYEYDSPGDEAGWELGYGVVGVASAVPCVLGALTVSRYTRRLCDRAAAVRSHLQA